MAEVRLEFSPKVAVKNGRDELLYWVNPASAIRLIKKELVIPYGTERCVRVVVAVEKAQRAIDYGPHKPVSLSQYLGQRYSHNHDAPDNPENVWTLKRLGNSLAPIFRQVVTDCMPKRKAKVIEFPKQAGKRKQFRKAA